MPKTYHIGVDISKDELVAVAYPQSHRKAQKFPRNAAGIAEFIKWARKRKPRLIVMEATGALERPLALELATAELPFRVVNPKQAKGFAEMHGPDKSDEVDAYRLGKMGDIMKLEPMDYFSAFELEVKDLIARRQQLVKIQIKEKTRLKQARTSFSENDIRDMLKTVKDKIKNIDRKIDETMDGEDDKSDSSGGPSLARKREIIQSIPGVGKTTARILLGQLPELGSLTKGAVTALSGLAPYRNQSGKTENPRHTGKGRDYVKQALYIAVLSAVRWNPKIKDKYQRLQARGKSKRVALIACMRKLIVRINAMVRNDTVWDPAHQSTKPLLSA